MFEFLQTQLSYLHLKRRQKAIPSIERNTGAKNIAEIHNELIDRDYDVKDSSKWPQG